MQKDIDQLKTANVSVVGVSYDSIEKLAAFSERAKISYPLLADTKSTAIKAYGLLNARARGRQEGIPHPATVVIDSKGIVKAVLPGTVRRRHSTKDLVDAASK